MTFNQWLDTQTHRTDGGGDFAQYSIGARPEGDGTLEDWIAYLRGCNATANAYVILHVAWSQFCTQVAPLRTVRLKRQKTVRENRNE